jgi:hypothetical protein
MPDELLADLDAVINSAKAIGQASFVIVMLGRCRISIAANAALAARCVPREPTEAMIAAAFEHWSGRCSGGIAVMWQAMYDAALARESESSIPQSQAN